MYKDQYEEFKELLLQYSQESEPQKRENINDKIWELFGEKRVVMVIDTAGFTVTTELYGAVHYLAMLHRMQSTVKSVVQKHEGFIIKFEADNCFILFEHSHDAVKAAIALNLALDTENMLTPNELEMKVSCGIDHGDVILLDNQEMFGSPVNLASKLGEDIATAGQILITKNAMQLVDKKLTVSSTPIKHFIADINIEAFEIHYR